MNVGICLTLVVVGWPSKEMAHLVMANKDEIYLDPLGRYHFQWSVDHQNHVVEFRLTAQVEANHWFAVGFSDYGEVTDADLVALWTDREDRHHFMDGHTDQNGSLLPDLHQDYNLTTVAAEPGRVVLVFNRAFHTCDPDDYLLDNGTTHVIYVESPLISTSPFGSDLRQATHGVQRVQIIKPELPEIVFPLDTWAFEITAPQIKVPTEETTYWWQTTLLPEMPVPHHIIQYEGVIANGSRDLVHHMEVFHCEVGQDEIVPFYSGPGLSEGKPNGLGACRKVIGAWAMGAKAMVYPEEAGVPIGGAGYPRVVLLEIHYNNPLRLSGHVDSSGIRFYVTSQLREFEAGIMELGLEYTDKMAVPPGQGRFALSGYCVQQCTRLGLPGDGIFVFASQLHTHMTGKKVFTRHVRKGRLLPELSRDNHYSPHFQEIRRLAPPVHVLPGDDLITTCEYDTSNRREVTVGGFSMTDEMCVNYIHYYPRAKLEVCKSSVQSFSLDHFMKRLNRLQGARISGKKDYRENFMNVYWSPINVRLLKTLYATSALSMQCNQSDGSRFPGDWEHIYIPGVTQLSNVEHSTSVC